MRGSRNRTLTGLLTRTDKNTRGESN